MPIGTSGSRGMKREVMEVWKSKVTITRGRRQSVDLDACVVLDSLVSSTCGFLSSLFLSFPYYVIVYIQYIPRWSYTLYNSRLSNRR